MNTTSKKPSALCLDHEGCFLHRECVRNPRGLQPVSAAELASWRATYGEPATCEVCGK